LVSQKISLVRCKFGVKIDSEQVAKLVQEMRNKLDFLNSE